jgi:hypothetical protein
MCAFLSPKLILYAVEQMYGQQTQLGYFYQKARYLLCTAIAQNGAGAAALVAVIAVALLIHRNFAPLIIPACAVNKRATGGAIHPTYLINHFLSLFRLYKSNRNRCVNYYHTVLQLKIRSAKGRRLGRKRVVKPEKHFWKADVKPPSKSHK